MKALSSKEPPPVLNRGGASSDANDHLEINEVSTFRYVNNTRKIHYPMMLRKYQIDKISNEDMDDFRKAVEIIVANSKVDSEKYDKLFTQSLQKHVGGVSRKNTEPAVNQQ